MNRKTCKRVPHRIIRKQAQRRIAAALAAIGYAVRYAQYVPLCIQPINRKG